MIRLEVVTSSDANALNTYEFFQNQIYIGRERGNLRIDDALLLESHVMIEVLDKDLIFHPQKGVDFYLLNGKRATEIRKLKAGDTFTIGASTLRVMGFEETHHPTKKELLNEKMKRLLAENSPRLSTVEKLISLGK